MEYSNGLKAKIMERINVASDFSIIPSGRHLTDGSATGEHFYNRLVKELSTNEKIVVNFDGVLTAGSSFLEEAFAGLIRNKKLSKREFNKRIEIVANEHPEIKHKIAKYVSSARA